LNPADLTFARLVLRSIEPQAKMKTEFGCRQQQNGNDGKDPPLVREDLCQEFVNHESQ